MRDPTGPWLAGAMPAPSPAPPLRDPAWIRAGLILDVTGQVMVPLGAGALLGFYAADQGMRLVPTLLGLVLGWGVAALLFIAIGRWLRGKAYKGTPQGVVLRRRVVFIAVLGVLALLGRLGIFWAHRPTDLTTLDPGAFDLAFEQDARTYQEFDHGMERLLNRLEAERVPVPDDARVLTTGEERLLLDSWRALVDYSLALDQIRIYYEDWYRFDPSRVERRYHLEQPFRKQ